MTGRQPALTAVGGPLGRHASARARSWPATVGPMLVVTAALVSLGALQRSHCVTEGWNGSDQFWHGCFSDLPALYRIGNLQSGLGGYLASGADAATLDQPVLTGAAMSLLGGFVPDGNVLDQTRWYFGLWALLAAALLLLTVYLTAASRPRHVADAWLLAASPLLVLVPLVSADTVGIALVAAGLWSWGRRQPLLAGALLGLGVAARTYPLLVLLALVLLGVRTGRQHAVIRTLLGALAGVAAVLLPFLVAQPGAITRAYAAWWRTEAGLGSVWMVPQLLGKALPAGAVTLLAVVGIAAACAAGAVFALGTTRRPTVAEVALVMVAVALVTGKSFPVQASLWLLPLAALCGVRWRDHLVWVGAEALHFAMVWLYLGGMSKADRGLPPSWYAAFLLLRVAAVLYLAWRVWHTAAQRPAAPEPGLHAPEAGASAPSEPVRAGTEPLAVAHGLGPDPDSDAVVDELAGDFTDAPDRLLVRLG